MTEVEQPPQNGIDPTAGEDDDNNKARPADIEQDMREMERRKRVEAIMGSKLFREELERIVDSAREGGAGANGILQQLSDIVGVPVNRVGNVFKSSSCMVPINDIRGVESMGYAKGEKILRCKLAATFRLLDLYGWTQGLGAQITARLKVDQEYFLVNPYGLLYHEITASALNKVDMQGQIVEQGTTNFGVNKSHFVLHSVVHAARPDIRCAIYIGCSPVVAISSLKSGLLALTKDACVLGEISTHAYTGLFDEEERNRLVRSLGPNSKVMLLANHGALCCGETIEEAFYAACHIVQACETQLKLLPVGVDNLVLIPEESRKLIYDQSRRPPEDLEKKFAAVTADDENAAVVKEEPTPKIGSPPKWRVGGAEFEALMRMLDNAGYRTGYIYRHPLIKSDPPKPKNDVELPPAVSSLGYLLEEEELFRQGIWKKGDLRKGGDRSRWLNSPNVYQKVEVLETGTPDPKKITKWVAEGSPTHSTPVRIEDPLQFVPAGTTTKEFKRVQQQIKDNRRADKISAGPQSHILEGVTWDEANRIKDATVSQTGDHVVLMGAASKGIIQRGFQHNATVYKAPYAKNPFDNVTDDELNEYKRTVERKKKSIHGEYTDTDFSESEALNSMQAAGAHAHAKHAQSEPETEHQVIQIQTQQAPIPSQAEVVLSDATLSFINGERSHTATNRKPPTGRVQETSQDTAQSSSGYRNSNIINDELDEENKNQCHIEQPDSAFSTRKCCRDLFCLFASPNSNFIPSRPCITPAPNDVVDLAQGSESITIPSQLQGDFYSYAYSQVPLSRCCQPQICSVLLQAIHSEHMQNMGYDRASTRSTATSSTGSTMRCRPVHFLSPYRTVSHFGFNSPRQTPRTEHRHMPAGAESTRYRPMHRVISYEEIFATPRYEQLCQSCFEQLLRLKPEIQRRSATSSSGNDPEYIISSASSSQKLTTLTELNDEDEYDDLFEQAPLTSAYVHASTQTGSTSASNFLAQIERFNFSEESTNVNYVPGLKSMTSEISSRALQTSPGASATSAPPISVFPGTEQGLKDPNATRTDVTEVWNFGNWQEHAQQKEQQPLTERRITLEITQQYNNLSCLENVEQDTDRNQVDQQVRRQLMARAERQRRKAEFEEIWQDHVRYYGAKKDMEQKAPTNLEHTLTISEQDGDEQTVKTYGLLEECGDLTKEIDNDDVLSETQPNGELNIENEVSENEQKTHSVNHDVQTQAVEELPKMLEDFEQSLSILGENLEKLVATTKKLQPQEIRKESPLEESNETGSLFRAISLDNIADADDAASVSEPQRSGTEEFTTDDECDCQQHEEPQAESGHEEKRDDEKPVTPLFSDEKECGHIDEKDVDENEIAKPSCDEEVVSHVEPLPAVENEIETLNRECSNAESGSEIFTPLERDILECIEKNKLQERESIFGRIDESIRNKLTPCKLQRIVSDVEETFRTYTHIFSTPPKTQDSQNTPHLFQFSSEPRSSSYSMQNSNARHASGHSHLIIRETSRLSRSWNNYKDSSESSSDLSRSSLKRTISSTTFVFRTSPRKKRNFIQENIRNASRPRTHSKTETTSSTKAKSQRRNPIIMSDSSSVCTFQTEQRSSSARLWVSLPPSPRDTRDQKRRSVSPNKSNYPKLHSPSMPYSMRRNPLGSSTLRLRRTLRSVLHKTVSNSTLLTEDYGSRDNGSLEQNVSSTTFKLDSISDEPESKTLKLSDGCETSPEKLLNGTNSSIYYSANDSTVTDSHRNSSNLDSSTRMFSTTSEKSFEQLMGKSVCNTLVNETLQIRLYGGKTTDTASQVEILSSEEGFQENGMEPIPSQSLSEAENIMGETRDNSSGVMECNEHRNENQAESIWSQDDPLESDIDNDETTSRGYLRKVDTQIEQNTAASLYEFQQEKSLVFKALIDKEAINTGSSLTDDVEALFLENLFVTLDNESNVGNALYQEIEETAGNVPDDDDESLDNVEEDGEFYAIGVMEVNSSSYSLTPTRATLNLNSKVSTVSPMSKYTDSSSDEVLLKSEKGLEQCSDAPSDTEDDNKPNTSAAAAMKKKKRKSGGLETGSENSEDDNVVVLKTQCTLRDGTLHITDEISDEIQGLRCQNIDLNRPNIPVNHFGDYEDWNIFELEDEEDEDTDELEMSSMSDSMDMSADTSPIIGDTISSENTNELSLEVELPLEGFNEFCELELEIDTDILLGNNSSEPVDLSLSGNYDFGPLIVECALNGEETRILVENSNGVANTVQPLEIAQNEVNQEQEMQANCSPGPRLKEPSAEPNNNCSPSPK